MYRAIAACHGLLLPLLPTHAAACTNLRPPARQRAKLQNHLCNWTLGRCHVELWHQTATTGAHQPGSGEEATERRRTAARIHRPSALAGGAVWAARLQSGRPWPSWWARESGRRPQDREFDACRARRAQRALGVLCAPEAVAWGVVATGPGNGTGQRDRAQKTKIEQCAGAGAGGIASCHTVRPCDGATVRAHSASALCQHSFLSSEEFPLLYRTPSEGVPRMRLRKKKQKKHRIQKNVQRTCMKHHAGGTIRAVTLCRSKSDFCTGTKTISSWPCVSTRTRYTYT